MPSDPPLTADWKEDGGRQVRAAAGRLSGPNSTRWMSGSAAIRDLSKKLLVVRRIGRLHMTSSRVAADLVLKQGGDSQRDTGSDNEISRKELMLTGDIRNAIWVWRAKDFLSNKPSLAPLSGGYDLRWSRTHVARAPRNSKIKCFSRGEIANGW